MHKLTTLIALAAATLLAASAAAHEGGDHPPGPMAHDGTRMAALHARHQARLHDQLKLTAGQEAAWKTFTEKTQPDLARLKAVHEELDTMKTPERLDRMLALMKEREARMGEHAAAVKAFYAQLDPAQQNIFDEHLRHRHAGGKGKGPRLPRGPGAGAAPAK